MSVDNENAGNYAHMALQHARRTISSLRNQANNFVDILLDGAMLRSVSPYRLARLKKQLKDFNAHTGRWKNDE